MDVIVLDGGLGTELSRRGVDTAAPLWSARALGERPDAVLKVHRAYVLAGARVLTTCTFRTHERSLALAGWQGRGDALNRQAVALAREAAAREGATGLQVAGGIGPLEDCLRPELVPAEAELAEEHARQAQSLAAAGADFLLVETMGSRREAVAATLAAVATGKDTWCSFAADGQGRLLSGEPLADAAKAVEAAGASAVLVNCLPAPRAAGEVARLREAVGVPVGAYPNIGHDETGFRAELMLTPDAFSRTMLDCRDAGATILGGCCGTQPEHVAALAAVV